MKKYSVKRSYKKTGRIMAIFLACMIFLNNESIYSVLAAENSAKAAADGGESQDTTSTPEQGGDDSGAVPGGGEGGGTESGPSEGGEGGGTESGPSEGGEGTVPGDGTENKPSEGGEGTVPGDGTENKPSEGGEGTVPGDGTENKPSEGGEGTVPGDGTENKPSEGGEGTVPGDGTENKPSEGGEGTVPGDGTENKPSEGNGSGTGDKTEETEPPEGDDIPEDELPADGIIDEEVKENDGEGEGENSACLEDREHEYEEILAEDGTVECYRCVFCQREISEETLEMEGAVLHAHLWNRAEGEIIPVCEDCGLARLDCDGEEGYGIHIFELIQEEGQPDRYRCAVCGEEKEFLDEWDMTAELFFEIMGISVYGGTYTYNGETSTLPTDPSQVGTTTVFLVQNLADLMALQELGNNGFNFEGCTVKFVFQKNSDNSTKSEWDLRGLKDDFKGLGSEGSPFMGTLISEYDPLSFVFQTATPLLNYVATGAVISDFRINASIEGTGADPVGGIAAHVVKSDNGDTVVLSDVTVSGTVANVNGIAGGFFGEVNTENDPQKIIKINYSKSEGNQIGISMSADVSGACAGGLVGKTEGAVEVYKTDVFPTGTVSGTEYAGMLAGSMEAGGTLFADGTGEACEVKVEGSGTNGGLAGKIADGTICRADQAGTQKLILTGSVTGGRNAGGLVGECADTKIKLNDVTVSADVTASAGNAGGMVGSYAATGSGAGNADAPDEDWNLLHHIEIGGNVRGTGNIGGIIGDIKSNNFRIGLPGEADNFDCMKVTGSIFADHAGACVGGMIGAAEGEYIEVYHVTMSGGEISGADTIGGIIGRVGNGAVVKIKNATVSSRLIPSGTQKIQGGLLGNVLAGSMAAMDGTIDVGGLAIDNSSLLRGHIAGKQDEALVYFEENCKYQRPTGKAWVDDIGNYGGVYRNGNWGEDGNPPLISYKEKKVLGTVASSGSGWVLDSEADMIRLAIVLNTEGRFAGDCFGNTGKADLLKADYSLTEQEYALEDSGIYAFNRNDRGNVAGERFTGKLTGTGKATIDLGECVTYQSYLSLFSCAGEGTEFRNLTVKRDIKYARDAAAGLAVYISGNVLVENVDMQVSLTGSDSGLAYWYGGMFADYSTAGASTLSVSKSRIGGKFEIRQNQYAGGLLAKYMANTSETPVIKIDGLEIAGQFTSGSRYISGMITQINGENAGQDAVRDRVTLNMQNITITKEAGIRITEGGETGGFLGWKWYGIGPCDGNYSIKNLVIGDGGMAADGPSYYTRGGYGGLVHTITGRIQLKNIDIQNGSFCADSDGDSNHNGLLFHNGHNALIELENYRIAGQGVGENSINYADNKKKVSVTGVTNNFGEVVGSNMGNDKDHRSYTNGGIVNIISPAFENSFIVNRSHVLDVKTGSNNTRYYYNLFGTSLDGEASFMQSRKLDGHNIVITDADQLIIWHLSQYMNEPLRRYLKPYFTGEAVPAKNGGATIKGTIDLNNKSYYPTPVQNCTVRAENSATIVFYGDQLDQANGGYTLAEKEVEGEGTRRENYMLQGGLLVSPEGGMTVQGDENYLTLKGRVTRLHEDSGALFVMSIRGTNSIYRIRLEDLYLRGYGGAAHGYGLMIGAVEDGTDMDISWIETKGYNSGGRPDYAAAALIGRVGTANAENLRLDFTNMKIGGLHPDKNPSDRSQAIFKYAIFIDFHHFTDNTQRNKGRVRYLFTEEAYKGMDMSETGNDSKAPFTGDIHGDNNYRSKGSYVTLGNELQNGVEYWNTEGEADFLTDGSIADWSAYLPYVCTANDHRNKDIQVNPKNVSIHQGCGTYEDPYQIESAKQLLALSYYLINGDNQEYLKDWQIRKPGDEESKDGNGICTKKHSTGTLKTYGNADFPTREELRKAYYIITDDIDFSKLRSSGDAAVVQSFVGLGTTEYPFSGVIVGEKKGDGSVPTITLPYKRKENTSDYFGLIEYAKGAVVKDVRIVSPEKPESNLLTKVVRVKYGGSAVIGCVLGGDNIIDNVTVETLMAVNAGTEGFDAAVGGYAGIVEQGSLILRNLSADRLSGFRFGLLSGNGEELDKITDLTNYPFASGAVGKVENGFVIYEGSVSDNAKILPHDAKNIAGIYSHAILPFSNTYDVITASGMENEKNKIQIGIGGNYTCHIDNAAQLQLVSMAINSDSFSIYYNENNNKDENYNRGGYDRYAACRKAEYNEVGKVTVPTVEYTNATKKDDGVYWYPYIYQYFSFEGTSAGNSDANSGSGFYQTLARYGVDQNRVVQYRSELNAVTKDVSASMTYELTAGGTYDLSVYRRGFRGLGATYRVFKKNNRNDNGATANMAPRSGVYSDFRANFNGNGATVKAEMVNDYAKGIHTAALFNDLVNTDTVNNYSIKNLTVTGTFRSSNSMEGEHRTNFAADRAAAVVGMMRRPWEISNVTAKNVDIWSKGQAAGIVAWINLPSETKGNAGAKIHSFTNCQVLSVKESGRDRGTVIHTLGGSCGGIVGSMATWHSDDLNGYVLKLEGCKVLGETDSGTPYYVYIENEGDRTSLGNDDQEGFGRGRSGGMVGHVGKHHEGEDRIATRITFLVTDSSHADADIQYVSINGSDSTGGVLGEYYGWRQNETDPGIKIENIKVSNSIIESKNRNETVYGSFGVGGIIGKLQREATCEITNTNVVDTDIRSVFGGMDNGVSVNANAPQGDQHAGGIIGYCYYKSRITMENIQVTGALKDGKPQYEITSRLSNAGGIIGACWNGQAASEACDITIKNGIVSGMDISSDSRSQADRDADKASGISTGAAGGVIGRASAAKNCTIQDVSVENCAVRSGQGAAGGVIGNAVAQLDSLLENISVTSCKIGSNGNLSDINASMGMGGIYGRVSVLDNRGSQKLKGTLKIEWCDIYGKNAGGIAGSVDHSQQIGNVWSDGNSGYSISIKENSLLGYYAGGAFGTDNSRKNCFTNVQITGNTIAAIGNAAANAAAGGFSGRKDTSSNGENSHNINDITVENNKIFSSHMTDSKKQSAGGAFGSLNLVNDIYAYNTVVKNNEIGFCDIVNDPAVKQIFTAGIAGQMSAVDAAMTAIKGQTVKLWNGSGFVSLPANLTEADVSTYSGYYGNLAGTYEVDKKKGEGHAYFLKPTVAYAAGTRPTVDVGSMAPGTAAGNALLSDPYAYRRNIHVIYFEPDISAANTAAGLWAGASMNAEDLFSGVNADEKLEEYRNVMGSASIAASGRLNAYRLNIINESGSTVSDIYKNVYKNDDGYLSNVAVKDIAGTEIILPMIVLDTQYGTVDQLMGGVLAALTGAGGVQNSETFGKNADSVYDTGINEIMDISVTSMKVENGAVVADNSGRKQSIRYNGKGNGYDKAEILYNNYDEEDEDGKGLTFSMLTVSYRQRDYAAINGGSITGNVVELKIPVYVVERLTIDTYLKMVEGEVYNADKAKEEQTGNNPLLANDSTYTLYMEYIYGSARDKYSTDDHPISIDKTLGITYTDEKGNAVPTGLWPGTRLTLIDVCDSNKVYYYTVKEGDTVIRYEQFLSDPEDPNSAYKNKPIHGEKGMDIYKDGAEFPAEDREEAYTDVAVERFLIVVDTSLVDEDLKLTTRNVRDYHMTPVLSDDIKKRASLTEHTEPKVTMQPGLTIGFDGKGTEGITDIAGIIQDGAEVEVDATFQITGEKTYWLRALNSQTTTIDSANHNKYLEVGIYFTDMNGNRVRLPDNTNVTVKGDRIKPWEEEIKEEENIGAYVNRTEVYFYKDGKIFFPLDKLREIVQKDIAANGENNFSGVISEQLKVILNFANADLSAYTENRYVVNLELLRIEDADYPAGGEVMDIYSKDLIARRQTDLACALETKDLMELGINTYQNQTPMPHMINFGFKLDFNGILSDTNHTMNQQLAEKYYTVSYHILEKTNQNGTPEYKPYTGNQLSLALTAPPSSDMQKGLQKGGSSVGEFGNSVYVTYKYALREIENGTGDAGKGVITRDLTLTVRDAAKMDLSNYKIVASVMVSDQPPGDIETEVNPALSDFFVFTIAKLKTDLDY